jgi:transcriptional regulator with PAS, ATPase and Fis domain
MRRLEELGVVPEIVLIQRVEGARFQPATWSEQTMSERLVIAMDRLSLPGLRADQLRREIPAIVCDLFPGHRVIVGAATLEHAVSRDGVDMPDGEGGLLRVTVDGSLSTEELAALRLFKMLVPVSAALRPPRAEERVTVPRLPNFIAVAPATRRLTGEIAQLSKSNATILITGESGSGKEVVARAVHQLSARADKPYVAFNCASVPRDLFEGQLFGYKKGAFTGATSDSPGVIRAADAGTLFLDEIAELPLDTQPKLLRFLENGEILPFGEQRPRRVDVRILAATHRDLGRLVREGRFREDLYYRLNVVPLSVPPLRERVEDVVPLARMFIERLTPEGQDRPELSPDAIAALEGYPWPGNVRELRNVCERGMAYAPVPSVLRADNLRIGRG